jgi:kynurenine 3-monooxygenase
MGYRVAVYERRPDPRVAGAEGGRSINLALSARGIKGLAGVGLADAILQNAIPMRGRMLHSRSGSIAFQAYSKNRSDAINSVSRAGLNLALIEAAGAYPNVELQFDHRCLDVDLDAPAAIFEHEIAPGTPDSKPRTQIVRVESDLVIGADGAFSAVRTKMQKTDCFQYEQSYLEHGYKELHIPAREASSDDRFAMEKNALHIWPRGGSMMIALPNADGSFTCTLFWPYEGRHSFAALKTPDQIERFFNEEYPDAVPLMPTLVEDYLRNPVGSLVTIKCRPWRYEGRVVLLGDAAHAIVPFYGQGMNCAFEDCISLADCLRNHPEDPARALADFESDRKENADAIADMALDNFIEMRDKVASRVFRLKKRLEHLLHAIFPTAFTPLYNMVSFSTIPYAQARRQAQRQSMLIFTIGAWIGAIALALLIIAVIQLFR